MTVLLFCFLIFFIHSKHFSPQKQVYFDLNFENVLRVKNYDFFGNIKRGNAWMWLHCLNFI